MSRFILRRLLVTIPLLFATILSVFFIMEVLPGDPVDVILGREGGATDLAAREDLRRRLGLDRPMAVRLADMIRRTAQGDLGRSLWSNQPVSELVASQAGHTMALAGAGILLAVAIGVPIGIVAAVKANSLVDLGLMGGILVLFSMPSFLLGVLLILVFSYWLGWVPVVRTGRLVDLLLPSLALGLPAAGAIARVTRSAMVEVLQEAYIVTARAKGLAERAVPLKHALRNALIPVITLVGFYLGYLITGTVIVETVFARPGVGRVVIEAILRRDFPVVQAVVLLGAVAFIFINLALDVAYAWLDPRISYR